MLYLKYTLSLVYLRYLREGQGSGTSSLGDEVPYYVQIHFQVVSEEETPEPNPLRTSLKEEEGGGESERIA